MQRVTGHVGNRRRNSPFTRYVAPFFRNLIGD